ncbi:PREDICTED: phosphatidylethanolamine-binding protein 4-like [Gekko japonicus]|uniref:Phosphatidylethanolamine-binding protein 4-like n=1 Tax=Gekko japonicus TaxID=146911 RepID=A0ABM1K7I8_GEKJA|nr:PREDICTED: phosphatidylethanolamine-binding protein 4-like [Gekko japonicus]
MEEEPDGRGSAENLKEMDGAPAGAEGGTARDTYDLRLRGADLKTGKVQGRVLTDYIRPTPPSHSGYHRYQFHIYEQPEYEAIALSTEEAASSGSWNMESFVDRFQLGAPVASTHFLTEHYGD